MDLPEIGVNDVRASPPPVFRMTRLTGGAPGPLTTHNPEDAMKVTRGTYGSILAAAVVLGSLPESATAAEAATCAEKYYACINETEEIEGFLERTWAEQKCNAAWYQCVKNQAFGA